MEKKKLSAAAQSHFYTLKKKGPIYMRVYILYLHNLMIYLFISITGNKKLSFRTDYVLWDFILILL